MNDSNNVATPSPQPASLDAEYGELRALSKWSYSPGLHVMVNDSPRQKGRECYYLCEDVDPILNRNAQLVERVAVLEAAQKRDREQLVRAAEIIDGAIPARPISEQVARWAIDGAILKGRLDQDPPPSDTHWLMEYWQIGRQLAKLGETSAWDNVTPATPHPHADEAAKVEWMPIETAPQDGYMLVHEDEAIRALLRVNGVWSKLAYPAIISHPWGEAIVGKDALRFLPAGYRLEALDGCCENPTHWMPLPAAPSSPAEGKSND